MPSDVAAIALLPISESEWPTVPQNSESCTLAAVGSMTFSLNV